MKPKEVVAARDVVWGLFDVGLCYDAKRTSGQATNIKLDMAIRWQIKDGKIIEHQAFFDTAHLVVQQALSRVD
jgi:hypothetical protein